MGIERRIRAIAGTFVLASLGLAHRVDARWLWFTAFVGANLLQSAFTRWCLMETILRRYWPDPPQRSCTDSTE